MCRSITTDVHRYGWDDKTVIVVEEDDYKLTGITVCAMKKPVA